MDALYKALDTAADIKEARDALDQVGGLTTEDAVELRDRFDAEPGENRLVRKALEPYTASRDYEDYVRAREAREAQGIKPEPVEKDANSPDEQLAALEDDPNFSSASDDYYAEMGESVHVTDRPIVNSFPAAASDIQPVKDQARDQLVAAGKLPEKRPEKKDHKGRKQEAKLIDPIAEKMLLEAGAIITPEEAMARRKEWYKQLHEIGKKRGSENAQKVILSLFDATGNWAEPFALAGFDVRVIDLKIDDVDVMDINQEWLEDYGMGEVHGILCANPCTDFTMSGNQWWDEKDEDGRTDASVALVHHTLAIIGYLKPDFWALENPMGRIGKLTGLGNPALRFEPYNYGDPYTKRTQIFGNFNPDLPTAPVYPTQGSKIHDLWGTNQKQKAERSATPEGFAAAFALANSNHGPAKRIAEILDEYKKGGAPDKTERPEEEEEKPPAGRNPDGWQIKDSPFLGAWDKVPAGGDPDNLHTSFLTGSHNPDVAKAAQERGDIGLLVTPLLPKYLDHAEDYPFIAVDNGVFSQKTPFSATKFRKLIKDIFQQPSLQEKTLFVVAPDVVGDAAKTLDQFDSWADEIHDRGLPVALAAQDGLEHMTDKIPWDKVDVLFVGGSTAWKTGDVKDRPAWDRLWNEAQKRGIPIHMGRVNTNKRMAGAAQDIGAATVDGTSLAFHPKDNLAKLKRNLDQLNVHGLKLDAQKFPELGRTPTDQELYELAFDEKVKSADQLGAFEPAAKAINAIRMEHGLETLDAQREEPSTQESNALQEQGPGRVLQHPPEGTGEGGGGRERVEPSVQGKAPAPEGGKNQPPVPEGEDGGDVVQPEDVPEESKVEVVFKDGTTKTGTMKRVTGNPTVFYDDGEALMFIPGQEQEGVEGIRVTKTGADVFAEKEERKFGKWEVERHPKTREEYKTTLEKLAYAMVDAHRKHEESKKAKDGGNYDWFSRRMQLEAQFDEVADQIDLAKTKRRYMKHGEVAVNRQKGKPPPRPADLGQGQMEAQLFEPPKDSDFDPSQEERRKRSAKPAHAYPTKAEVEGSLADARYQAKTTKSKTKREQMERIVEERTKQLATGKYMEAVQEAEEKAKPKTFPKELASRLLSLSSEQIDFPFGDRNAELRRDVLEAITGKRPPKAKAGASAVRDALKAHFGTQDSEATVEALRKATGEATPEPETQLPTPSFLDKTQVHQLPVAGLKLSKDVPQFKHEADESGVVTPLGSEKYEKVGTGSILVWQRLNGDMEVITGRHRFDLAKRTGEPTIPAQVVREADGFGLEDALRADAEINIRDGHGSIKDFASYLRHSDITEQEAKAAGLLDGAKGRAGWAIGREASEALFDLHANGRISDAAAVAITEAAPGNEGLQRAGIKEVLDGHPIDTAVNLMRAMGARAGTQKNADQQLDLLGQDDSAMVEMREQAKRASAEQRTIKEQIAAAKGAAKNPKAAAKLGVNVNDPVAVNAKLKDLSAELERWKNWPLHPDLLARASGESPAKEQQPPAQVTGTGDMFSGRPDEPFNLISESKEERQEREARELKVESDRKAQEAEAARKAAEKQQGNLFDEQKPKFSIAESEKTGGDPYELLDFTPKSEAELHPDERAALASLNRDIGNDPRTAKLDLHLEAKTALPVAGQRGTDREGNAAGAAALASIEAFAEATGKRVVFIGDKDGHPLPFNAVTHPQHPDVIFVNRHSNRPVMALMGHEWGHTIAKTHPTLWRAFRDEAFRQLGKHAFPMMEEVRKREYAPEDIPEEVANNVIGDVFMQPEFWQGMKKDNPTLWHKMVAAVTRWVDSMISKVRRSAFGTTEKVQSIEDTRRAVIDLMHGSLTKPRETETAPEAIKPAWQQNVAEMKAANAAGKVPPHQVTTDVSDLLAGRKKAVILNGLKNEEAARDLGNQLGFRVAELPQGLGWIGYLEPDAWKPVYDAYKQHLKGSGENAEIDPLGHADIAKALGESPEDVDAFYTKLLAERGVKLRPSASHEDVQSDAEYTKAVASGDMETAQRMVDEAAKKAGYTYGPVFHRTWKDFDVFKPGGENPEIKQWEAKGFTRTLLGPSGRVIFFAPTKESAQAFHNQTKRGDEGKFITAHLKLKNPLIIDKDTKEWAVAVFADGHKDFPSLVTDEAIQKIKDAGYDGIVNHFHGYSHEAKPDEVMVFDPEQAKSSEPITRDEDGNVIPPSQRFNPKDPRLSFSAEGGEPEEDEGPLVNMTHAGIDEARAGHGMRMAAKREKMDMEEEYAAARADLYRSPEKADEVANAILNDGYRATPREKAVMAQSVVQLHNQIEHAPGDPRNAALYERLDNLYKAYKLDSSSWGQEGNIIQQSIKRDYSLAGLIRRVRMATGAEPTAEMKEKILQISKDFDKYSDVEKREALDYTKKVAFELIDKLEKEHKEQEAEGLHWLEEAMDSLGEEARTNVDFVLDEVRFQQMLTEKMASMGLKFSSDTPDQRTAANRARDARLEARIKALGTLTPEVAKKAIAESDARLEKLAKAFVDPKQKEAIKKAQGGDKTALKILDDLANPKKATPRKLPDPVKKLFADQVKHPMPKDKFEAEMKKHGVQPETLGKLHDAAQKKRGAVVKKRVARMKLSEAATGEKDEGDDMVMSIGEIEEALREAGGNIHDVPIKLLHEAMKTLIAGGARGQEEVIPALHKLTDAAGISGDVDEVRERAVNYGAKRKLPSQEELAKALRETVAEAQKMSQIMRAKVGDTPKGFGSLRDKPHQKLREYYKALKDAMKNVPSLRSAADQLKSAQDATLTRLTNDIEDLEAQIEAGKRTIRDKTPASFSPEFTAKIEKLKEQKKQLQEALEAIDPRKAMDEAERERRLIASAQRSAEYWKERVKNGEWEDQKNKRPISQAVTDARKIASDMKEIFEQAKDAARPDFKMRERIDMRKKQIDSLIQKARERLAFGKKQKGNGIYTPEAEAVLFKDQQDLIDELHRLKVEMEGKPGMSDEVRLKNAENAAEKALTRLQAQIDAKDFTPEPKKAPVGSPKLTDLREQLDLLREVRDAMKYKEGPSEEELALKRYARHLDRKEAELKRRIAAKDFSKVPRRETRLDPATTARKTAVEALQRKFNRMVAEEVAKNRTVGQKAADFLVRLKRFSVLSSPVVFGKLAAASVTRGFTTALEEVASGAWEKVLPKEFTSQAKLESGFLGASGWITATKRAWEKSFKDAQKTVKEGESDLDSDYSKQGQHDMGLLEIPGRLHAMMKAPLKRFMFEHAFQKLAAAYIRDGHSPMDVDPDHGVPEIVAKIGQAAYKAANRSIFLQDNALVDMWNAAVKRGEGMKGTTGPTIARAMKVLTPIVRVPSNIVSESAQLVGGVPIGLTRLIKAWHTGFEKLTPDEADSIMRTLKKGSFGAGLVLLGFYANNPAFQAGGYYNHDEKRKPGDPKVGGFKIFGQDIPTWLTHAPAFEAIQFGATMRRAMSNTKHGSSLPASAQAAAIGLAEETPFLNEMLRTKYLTTAKGREQFFGEMAKSHVEPELLQKIAQWGDRTRPATMQDVLTGEGQQKRKANTFGETMKSGIPGMRKGLSYTVDSPFSPRRVDDVPEVLHQYAQKGNPMPSTPTRAPLEKKAGHALPNEVWNSYTDIRGRSIERQMLNNLGYLSSPISEKQKKQRVMEIARKASYEASHALGIKE